MRQILLQNATDITKYGSCYYKMRQILLQNTAAVITKCDSYYYKMRQILQNATAIYYKMRQVFFITKCESYYKMRRLLQIAQYNYKSEGGNVLSSRLITLHI